MSQHAREYGFVELASLPVLVPLLLVVSFALGLWHVTWALGFALGASGALVSSYLSLLHLRRLVAAAEQGAARLQRSAASGALASVALMAGVLGLGALASWLNFAATAAGLLVTKLLIGFTPTLRRHDGRDR